MDLPTSAPEDLAKINFLTDRDLYDYLLKNTDRLMQFFSLASDDETWSSNHLEFYQLVLKWFSERFFEDRLDFKYAKEIVRKIHAHYLILQTAIPRSLTLTIGKEAFRVNPLILGTLSPYFRNLLRLEERLQPTNTLTLKEGDPQVCEIILNSMEIGENEELWKLSEKEIEAILMQAEKWRVLKIVGDAQTVLCRYITENNLIEKLTLSLKKERQIIFNKCVEIFNAKGFGARLFDKFPDGLGFEFLDFHDKTLFVFEKLKKIISHLIVRGELTQDDLFEKVIQNSDHLVGLDIGGSNEWSSAFNSIPHHIVELSCARSSWVNEKTLKDLARVAPQIELLSLSHNTQINYLSLGSLKYFKNLKNLDLSFCYQIGDSELTVILQSVIELNRLSLYGCKKLTDQAFSNLSKRGRKLQEIDLSKTFVSDGALIEIGESCRELKKIHLNHCLAISDRGLRTFLQVALGLQEISIINHPFQDSVIQSLRSEFPEIKIVTSSFLESSALQ